MWKHSAVPCCIKRSGGLHEEEKKEEKNTENRVSERSGFRIYIKVIRDVLSLPGYFRSQ